MTPHLASAGGLRANVYFPARHRRFERPAWGAALGGDRDRNTNLDKTSWTKVYDFKDDGAWAGDMVHCGGSNPLIPITWGGPIATFRWDNASDVDFKWLSVREIQVQ